MREAIMLRSQLENKFYHYRTEEYRRALKKKKIIVTDFTKGKEKNTIPN